jgi:integrase
LRGAHWEEIDFDWAEWRLPAERMKMADDHVVPLSQQAIDVLRELEPLTGSYDLVFSNQNNLSKPMSENTLQCSPNLILAHHRLPGLCPNCGSGQWWQLPWEVA